MRGGAGRRALLLLLLPLLALVALEGARGQALRVPQRRELPGDKEDDDDDVETTPAPTTSPTVPGAAGTTPAPTTTLDKISSPDDPAAETPAGGDAGEQTGSDGGLELPPMAILGGAGGAVVVLGFVGLLMRSNDKSKPPKRRASGPAVVKVQEFGGSGGGGARGGSKSARQPSRQQSAPAKREPLAEKLGTSVRSNDLTPNLRAVSNDQALRIASAGSMLSGKSGREASIAASTASNSSYFGMGQSFGQSGHVSADTSGLGTDRMFSADLEDEFANESARSAGAGRVQLPSRLPSRLPSTFLGSRMSALMGTSSKADKSKGTLPGL